MRIPTYAQYQQQAALMSVEYDKLTTLMNQADSGKKLLHSSDDPVLASQIKTQQTFMYQLQNYYDNGVVAASRASLINSSMANALNIGSQVQTLVKKAESGTLNDVNRAGLARELEGQLANLINIANTKDSNGGYIFSGSNTVSPAYTQVNGNFQYQGSTDTTSINIAPNVSTTYNESGFNVFGDIFQGNGIFTISAGGSNVGAASATPGSVVDQANYIPDTYTVTFVNNGSGELAYQVVGAASGQVIPTPPATTPANAPTYVAGSDITFNGITFNVSGLPVAGDTLTVQPSTRENIFNTIQNMINLLSTPITNQGTFNQQITQLDASFGQVLDHLTTYQSEAGTRAAAINTQVDANKTNLTTQTVALSNLENIDIPTVYSAVTQQSLILQTTQAGYLKMQDILTKILQMQF